jgi:hypothetical protein
VTDRSGLLPVRASLRSSSAAQQVDAVEDDLRDVDAHIAKLAASVSDEQWTRRPPSGGWSAAECIAHLTLTTVSYVPLLAAAQTQIPRGGRVPQRYRRGFAGMMLEYVLEPPSRARSKTIAAFIPGAAAPKEQTVSEFSRSQRELLAWIDSARALPLDRMMIASPFNARLRYNAYAALRVIAAHQRRHYWQADRALRGIP